MSFRQAECIRSTAWARPRFDGELLVHRDTSNDGPTATAILTSQRPASHNAPDLLQSFSTSAGGRHPARLAVPNKTLPHLSASRGENLNGPRSKKKQLSLHLRSLEYQHRRGPLWSARPQGSRLRLEDS